MQISSLTIRLTFLGGALGTLARFGFFVIIGDLPSVIFVNIIGSALLGLFNGNKKYDTDTHNAFWKIGFAGGFTTMSGFASLIVLYAQGIGPVTFALALVITGLGLGAYWLAFVASRAASRKGDA
jgi:fluoride ion exporter CrcB/FEX